MDRLEDVKLTKKTQIKTAPTSLLNECILSTLVKLPIKQQDSRLRKTNKAKMLLTPLNLMAMLE